MRKVLIESNHVAYDEATDTLLVSLGDFDPDLLDGETEIAPDVYVQYAWPSGALAFLEIWHFSRHYGPYPQPVVIETPEGVIVEVMQDVPAFA